jgi:spermidine synthase
MVANIFTYDPDYAGALERLSAAFDARLAWPRAVAGNNRILFAQRPPFCAAPTLLTRLQRPGGVGWGWTNRLLVRLLLVWLLFRPI